MLHTEGCPSTPQTRTRTMRRSRDDSGANGQGTSTDWSDSTRPIRPRSRPSDP
ncbi:MAG: hypothetical protein ACJ797_06545 [Ktedonobacteraceae bacterium]